MRSSIPNGRRQSGVTLIELLVTLVIGLVLMAGVVSIFVANRTTFNIQEELAHLQENGRFAIQMIERDLLASGFRGCKSRLGVESNGRSTGLRGADQTYASTWGEFGYAGYQETTNTLNGAATDYQLNFFSSPMNGFDSTGSTWSGLPTSIDDIGGTAPSANSDILTVRLVREGDAEVVSHPTHASALTVRNADDLEAGDIVMVSDCTFSAVFQVTGVTQNGVNTDLAHAQGGGLSPGNATTALRQRFDNQQRPGRVYKIVTRSYLVTDDPDLNDPDDGPALWRFDDADNPQQLVQGVEMLQIDYGVDNDTNPDGAIDVYLPASAIDNNNPVANWSRVLGVRISLLLRSMDDVLDAPQGTINVGTQAFVPADNFLRKVFSTTIAMRNLVQ